MNEPPKSLKGYWILFSQENSPLPANYVIAPFMAAHQATIWINVWLSHGLGVPARKHGLFSTNGVDWLEYKFGERGLPTVATEHMAVDGRNQLWLAVPHIGICCFNGHSTVPYAFGQTGLPRDLIVADLCIDGMDRVWVATLGHGMYRLEGKKWQRITGDTRTLSDFVLSFGVDRRNDLWLVCEDREETRFLSKRSGSWEMVSSLPLGGKHKDEVVCFVIDRDDRIWAGRRLGGLMVWEKQRWQRLTDRDCPLLVGEIQSLAIDESDNLWVGTAGGFAVFDDSRWHDWGAIRPGTSEQAISRDDLLSADPETISRYVYIGGFIAVDSIGRKWLTSAKGLVMFTPELH
jgi:hypothetical protein